MYRLDAPAGRIAAALGADANGDVWSGGDVTPGGYAPVVVGTGYGRRAMVPRQWGVPPPPRGENTITHVRNLDSPFWIGPLRHTQFRCLVPVTQYRLTGKVWCAVRDMPVFAMAGLWRDSEVPSFAILTTSTPEGGSMPVILRPQDYALWLQGDWKQAQHLAVACPPGMLVLTS
jgi:putative SOS response-associated peptidase YedK